MKGPKVRGQRRDERKAKQAGGMKRTCYIKAMLIFFALCFSVNAQEKTVRAYFENHLVEVSADSNIGDSRVVTIKVNGQGVKVFTIDAGFTLDVLATYKGFNEYYLVLRTNIGSGACVGTDLYVLKISFVSTSNSVSHADVSPRLRDCMGEVPDVHFILSDKGGIVVAVFDNELRGGKWIKQRRARQ